MAGGWPAVTHGGTSLNTLLHVSSLRQAPPASLGSPCSHPEPAECLTLENDPGVVCLQLKAFLLWRREALKKRKKMSKRKVAGRACGKGQKHFADTRKLRSKMVDLSKNTTTLARVHGNSFPFPSYLTCRQSQKKQLFYMYLPINKLIPFGKSL